MKYVCSIHGKLNTLGRQPKFCPICGKEVIKVFFCPKIYIEKRAVLYLLLSVLAAGFVFSVVKGIQSGIEHSRKTNSEVESRYRAMTPQWTTLYLLIKNSPQDDRVQLVKEFLKVNGKDVEQFPPMTNSDIAAFNDVTGTWDETKIMSMLMPYTVGPQQEKTKK